jgi:deoxyribodipyrimidine photolyase
MMDQEGAKPAHGPALHAAMAGNRSMSPVFVLDDEAPGAWLPAAASRWRLHHSLAAPSAGLPDGHIHAPWEAPDAVPKQAGVRLGSTYPAPMAGLAEGRDRAMAAYRSITRAAQ